MKIRDIRAAGLRGRTPKGGWTNELQPQDCVHTLIAVLTDEGLTGWGSAYTSDELVRGALTVLRPMCVGQSALEPEHLTELLHQSTFWLGRGGSVNARHQRNQHRLVGHPGQAAGQPVGRLLGGRYRDRVKPYASLLMQEPDRMPGSCCQSRTRGFALLKLAGGRLDGMMR